MNQRSNKIKNNVILIKKGDNKQYEQEPLYFYL
jgi:hypothetical protein